MVRWVHVVSSGTSVLCNFERLRSDVASSLGVSGWCRADSEDPVQGVALCRARPGDPVFDALLDFVGGDPEVASAELNAFLKYVGLSSHAPPPEVGVLIYSSDTGTGYLCASVIQEYLRRRGYALLTPNPIRIPGLGRSEEAFDDALSNLLDLVVRKIIDWSRKGVPVYINATGGYKAETQFLVLAAAVAGAKAAYYIHETFRDVIELPLPPLRIDERLEKLVRVIKAEGELNPRRYEEICSQLGVDPQELMRDRKIITQDYRPRKWLLRLVTGHEG